MKILGCMLGGGAFVGVCNLGEGWWRILFLDRILSWGFFDWAKSLQQIIFFCLGTIILLDMVLLDAEGVTDSQK
jgi:hypothetical protein